jgi:hypothetical protein
MGRTVIFTRSSKVTFRLFHLSPKCTDREPRSAYCWIPYYLPAPESLNPYFLYPTPFFCTQTPFFCTQTPIPCTQTPISCTQTPIPYSLFPVPILLFPVPKPLFPVPPKFLSYSLFPVPKPFTRYLEPWILNLKPLNPETLRPRVVNYMHCILTNTSICETPNANRRIQKLSRISNLSIFCYLYPQLPNIA